MDEGPSGTAVNLGRAQQLLDLLEHVFIVKEANGGWLVANQQARKLFCSPEECDSHQDSLSITGLLTHLGLDAGPAQAVADWIEQGWVTEVVGGGEKSVAVEQGEQRICRWTEYSVQPQEQSQGVRIVVGRDVTNLRQTEIHLREIGKMSLVAEMAAGIAHEIRNPMTALKGFVQLLRERVEGHQDYFDLMLSELQRIEFIITEFLDLARPHVYQSKPQDLNRLVEQVSSLMQTQAIVYNADIQMTPSLQPVQVSCDENQLKQVFINILKNAIEAMPKGGTIRVGIHTELDNSQVTVRVCDEGVGMTVEQLQRMGQAFYTTKKQGTGLGMLVTQKIIRSHGGRMDIHSTPGKGTCIDVTLQKQV